MTPLWCFNSKVKNDVTLKQVLSSPAGPIVDEEVFSADKLTDADTIIKGEGFRRPYILTSYKANEVAGYSKNDSYQGLTPAKNSTVQVKYFADSSNLKMAVQQGQVDVAYRSLTPTDIDDLSKDSRSRSSRVRAVRNASWSSTSTSSRTAPSR